MIIINEEWRRKKIEGHRGGALDTYSRSCRI